MTRERFIEQVRQQQEPLRRFLLALCAGNGALADDIAQDALVRAYVASGSSCRTTDSTCFPAWPFWLPVSAWSWAERPRIPENQRLIKSTTRSNNCEMFIFAFKMIKIRMQ